MIARQIDILGIQETKQKHNSMENREGYTIYFSGQDRTYKTENNRFDAGVGIIVSHRLKKYIHKITPINDRLMYIELKTAIPTFIVSKYAPTAEAEDTHKNRYYEILHECVQELKKKGIIYLLGDFNARIQIKQDETETPIGKHTFDPTNNLLHMQSDNTADNRNIFIAFCTAYNFRIINTMFPKPEQYKYTYAEPEAKGEPYKRHRYEMLDYVLTTNEWKNTIRNTRTDPPSQH